MNIKGIYHLLLIALFLVNSSRVISQENTIFDDNRLNYNREIAGGFFLHNFGWGLNFKKHFKQTVNKQRYFELQFAFSHHPKQRKVFNGFIQDSKGYYFGKLNTFFVFRGLYGKKHIIAHKIRSSGVELSYNWGLGPSFGFLKPVYLEIVDFEYGLLKVEKYDPEKHNIGNIYGRASGFKGMGELQFRPGIYLKFGLQIEYSGKKKGVSGVEAGIALDAYFQQIEMMADIENIQFFPMIYLSFFFGTKYDKM